VTISDSIILVNFTDLRRLQDMPPPETVVDAGAVPFRPMLTAAAVVVDVSVILSDPIFRGLALSLTAMQVGKHGRGERSLPRSRRSVINQLKSASSEALDRQLVFRSALTNRNLDMSQFRS